jgi:hypothetical protein
MLPQLLREQTRLQISADLNCWQNGELKAAAAPTAGVDSGSLLEACASLKPAALDVCVNVKLVGSVPSELPRPRFPALSMVNLQAMIVDAFFLAILILMEHVTRVILTASHAGTLSDSGCGGLPCAAKRVSSARWLS